MDKFTSISIEAGASARNSFKGNICTNSSYSSDNKEKQDCAEVRMEVQADETTITAAEAQRARLGPKTDETIETLARPPGPHNLSNKSAGSPQLRENVQQLGDQGRKSKSKENQGASDAPSCEYIQKGLMSESLSNLLAYGSSSDDSDRESSVFQSESESEENSNDKDAVEMGSSNENENELMEVGQYRENESSSSSDESSDSESSDDDSEPGARSETVVKPVNKPVHNKDELELDNLPPVPDLSKLNLNVKEEECIQMGNVTSVVDRLVTIQSLPNTPAYDLDTLLFLDQGKRPLGHIYDVLGQVTSPMYVVRFNSRQEIESKGISKGLPVYSAPNTEHTQYVFLKELMKIKGSDASWKGDAEVPPEFLDFSDDDAEYSFSKQSLNEQDVFKNKRKHNSMEKHRMFEATMNLKNKVDTARHKMRDTYEPAPKRYVPQTNVPAFYYHPPPTINQMRQQCGTSFARFPPPNFTGPPPNFGFLNMGPTLLGMNPFANQFGMPAFPPNPQSFGAHSFGPPSIPPLPVMPHHVLSQPQPPPPAFAGSIAVFPPPSNSAMTVHKQHHPKPPKPSSGVVPKAQPAGHKPRNGGGGGQPKLYIPPPANYQQPYPPSLGLPKSTIPPFVASVVPPPPPNIPVRMPPPFGPPMPPWHYNLPRNPINYGAFRPLRGSGRQYKKQ